MCVDAFLSLQLLAVQQYTRNGSSENVRNISLCIMQKHRYFKLFHAHNLDNGKQNFHLNDRIYSHNIFFGYYSDTYDV